VDPSGLKIRYDPSVPVPQRQEIDRALDRIRDTKPGGEMLKDLEPYDITIYPLKPGKDYGKTRIRLVLRKKKIKVKSVTISIEFGKRDCPKEPSWEETLIEELTHVWEAIKYPELAEDYPDTRSRHWLWEYMAQTDMLPILDALGDQNHETWPKYLPPGFHGDVDRARQTAPRILKEAGWTPWVPKK